MPLRLGVWNVQGLVGTPTKAHEFIQANDLVVLTETKAIHSAQLSVPDGFALAVFSPALHHGAGTPSGGIAILTRNAVCSASLWRSGPCRIWARVVVDSATHPLMLGAVYLPPSTSTYAPPENDFFEGLAEEATDASAVGPVVVAGDFNTRIGNRSDVGDADAILAAVARDAGVQEEGLAGALPARTSQDVEVNDRADVFLRLCHTTPLAIVNGRVEGDREGAATSYGSNRLGCSVVDYILVQPEHWGLVRSLAVREAVSDHATLSAALVLPSKRARAAPPLGERLPRQLAPRRAYKHDPLAALAIGRALRAALPPAEFHGWATAPSAFAASRFMQAVTGALVANLRQRRPQRARRSKTAQPWFTPALRLQRDALHRLGVDLRALPGRLQHPEYGRLLAGVKTARSAYTQAVQQAQRSWSKLTASNWLAKAETNRTRFWARIHDTPRAVPSGSPEETREFFEAQLNPDAAPLDPETLVAPRPPLDPPRQRTLDGLARGFTASEVLEGLSAMKTGRAADEWGIRAETLRLFDAIGEEPEHVAPLVALFDCFFYDGFPAGDDLQFDLGASMLVPIYKGKGAADNLDNFRGISILPAVSKLYALLMERRLTGALEACGLRGDSQFGFRRGRGTAEAAFVLDTLVRHCASAAEPLYLLFVDFRKAFDSVQRPLLWQVLRNLGLPVGFISAVESYYSVVNVKVELAEGLTPCFPAAVGVKQGCPLSPTLFGVFIEALVADFMKEAPEDLRLPRLEGVPVPPGLYADDLALAARGNVAALQQQCDRLSALAARYGLTINVEKTKAMIVGPKRLPQPLPPPVQLEVGDERRAVEWVHEFRYLGLILSDVNGFTAAPRTLLTTAQNRYYAMWRRCRELGIQDGTSLCVLFDSLVSTVLCYGAPIWGPATFETVNALDPGQGIAGDIERLQRQFQRSVLGLPPLAPSNLVALETQRPPLQLTVFRAALQFLQRLACQPADSLLGRAFTVSARNSKGSWISSMRAWATRLKAPELPTFSERFAAGASAVSTRGPRVLPPVAAAADRALEAWAADLCTSLTSADGGTLVDADRPGISRPRAVRTLSLRPPAGSVGDPRKAASWTRRLPELYRRFPTLAARKLVAATRLSLPVRGLSCWSSRPLDAGPQQQPPPCPDCPAQQGAGGQHLAPRKRPRPPDAPPPLTLEHALECPGATMRAARRSAALDRGPLHELLISPPSSWPSFVLRVSDLIRAPAPGNPQQRP